MINIKRILCPTDLSPHAGDAVRYALAFARAHEAELILLHCTNDVDREYKLATSVLGRIDPSDTSWRFVTAPAEDVGEEIIAQAQLANADLIVMRSRRRPHRASAQRCGRAPARWRADAGARRARTRRGVRSVPRRRAGSAGR